MEKKIDFEAGLKRLEEIVDKISNSKVSLDESLLLYKEAQDILKALNEELTAAQEKVEKVIEIE